MSSFASVIPIFIFDTTWKYSNIIKNEILEAKKIVQLLA